ncbi:hypothetical protein, partial [Burkholderia cenocepacia]|uniref:hypothetical protein n=1 Tax=Burkholderia cenocepacia TaxID=95486 RepID=UPI00222E9549
IEAWASIAGQPLRDALPRCRLAKNDLYGSCFGNVDIPLRDGQPSCLPGRAILSAMRKSRRSFFNAYRIPTVVEGFHREIVRTMK